MNYNLKKCVGIDFSAQPVTIVINIIKVKNMNKKQVPIPRVQRPIRSGNPVPQGDKLIVPGHITQEKQEELMKPGKAKVFKDCHFCGGYEGEVNAPNQIVKQNLEKIGKVVEFAFKGKDDKEVRVCGDCMIKMLKKTLGEPQLPETGQKEK
jgi:hypothetical protein